MTTIGQGPSRRGALTGMLGLGLATPAIAQGGYPNRPITVVVGFPPGGQTDFAARILQPGLSAALGQSVVIDNRGGAGGNLGTDAVLRSRPDGYTLLAGNANPLTINPHTFQGMTIDPLRLTPVGLMLQSSLVLCVHPSVPAKTPQEFAAWARTQPNGVDYGSASAGSLSHVAMEMLKNRIGNPPMEHVPYRGSGPAMQDFIAGRFSIMCDAASVVAPFLRAGQIRGMLSTGTQRIPAFPDLPTSAEQGLPDYTFTAWIGLFGPPGLPPEIVARLNTALNTAVQDASVRERITSQGDEPGGGTAESLGETMRRDHARWGEVVRANNIRADG
ncbi:Bug family tripartite tricarboxylate transporter substrate binding protein [Belnapia rosea]|uniref:Tripartite-type tricarboxylate transporter, receptor component TctC n=1 Tax=Belnapia rosea TaxID=938405 RepID=A0A1G6SNF1_9PROT|nr:tripartite tricarboxylate transporter substrate binding protein [Belnapia rosea]SDB61169.1 Tripartite-type tricarboxylate transporter, receptor component TctC [Belnapia rosea]SDD18442.1 Tripartite-type tricarboxylate transporter, receptor component TctC [Belnapia rosea]